MTTGTTNKYAAAQRAWRLANPEKVKAYAKAWREANPEKAAAASRAWRLANPEKAAALQKAWRKANPEKVAASVKAWREANPEKVAAMQKAWREANPDKVAKMVKRSVKAAKARRQTPEGMVASRWAGIKARAKKSGRGVKITPTNLSKILNESGMVCGISGVEVTLKSGERHVASFDRIDNNKGYVYGNVQVVSAYHNTAKLDLPLDEYIAECQRVVDFHNAKKNK